MGEQNGDLKTVECGLCLDECEKSEFDIQCHICKFYMCYKCMFEYMNTKRKQDRLPCPHCRGDLYETVDVEQLSNLMSLFLVQQDLERIKSAFDAGSDDDFDTSDED